VISYIGRMPSRPKNTDPADLVQNWALPFAATLGSTIRAVGLFLEVRARLPVAARTSLTIKARELTFRMPQGDAEAFATLSRLIATALEGMETLPLLPREIEDILAISTTERHRWLKDGRLPSAGTRTVSLRGRARKITFHVFDPRLVEDILDRALVDIWREDDAATAAENRRRGPSKAKLKRSAKSDPTPAASPDDATRPNLRGWEEFEREGLLR
jgi:hypothetical protein